MIDNVIMQPEAPNVMVYSNVKSQTAVAARKTVTAVLLTYISGTNISNCLLFKLAVTAA